MFDVWYPHFPPSPPQCQYYKFNLTMTSESLQSHANIYTQHSPSQNTQSHAQRKQVVTRALLHKLHDRDGATGRDDEMDLPDELPGGIGPARVDDIVFFIC